MVVRDNLHYMNRINSLKTKGEVMNETLIKKCMRKIYKLEREKAGA